MVLHKHADIWGIANGILLMKNWAFQKPSGSDVDYPYDNVPKELDDAKIPSHESQEGIPNYKLLWESQDVLDELGLAASGNPNPFALFYFHHVVAITEPGVPVGEPPPCMIPHMANGMKTATI